jgi:hypothetical protein
MLLAAAFVAIPFTATAHKKLDQECSEVGLVMSGHAIMLSSITTQVVLELYKLPLKKRATMLKAAKAVDVIGGTLSNELGRLSLTIVLRNGGFSKAKGVSDTALKTHVVNIINDLETYYMVVTALSLRGVADQKKKDVIMAEIRRNYSAFQLLAKVTLRNIIKRLQKKPVPKPVPKKTQIKI